MRLGLTLLLLFHGALHLLGFLKWSTLMQVPTLSGRTLINLSDGTGRVFSILWLVAAAALFLAAALRIHRSDAWWVVAGAGVLVSQALILVAWYDARFGTLANVLVLIAVLIAAADQRFRERTDQEIRALLESAFAPTTEIQPSEVEALPVPVRRWLQTSGVVGHPRAKTVSLEQRGWLRTRLGGPWMPAQARQYFSVDPPGFVWNVRTRMMGVLPITGRDKYVAQHGHMQIQAASLFNIVDAADDKVTQGSLLRYLGEMVWFPSAAVSRAMFWETVDEHSAKATLRDGARSVSATFTFDTQGRVVSMQAERHMGSGPDSKLLPWGVTCWEWRKFDGVEIPVQGAVRWMLPEGEFVYYQWEISNLSYNPNALSLRETHRRARPQLR